VALTWFNTEHSSAAGFTSEGFCKRAVRGPITSIATELCELAELHDSEDLTDEEFTKLKRRLLSH
jgi:hypothetical protein